MIKKKLIVVVGQSISTPIPLQPTLIEMETQKPEEPIVLTDLGKTIYEADDPQLKLDF